MPIYKPEHYEEAITRIRKKLIVKKIKMGKCLSEEMIAALDFLDAATAAPSEICLAD